MGDQCQHVKPDGSRCRAKGRPGSGLCFAHDPALQKKRDAARKAGGKSRAARTVVLPPDTPDLELKTLADVAGCLAATINQVRKGLLDVRVGNAVGYLCATLAKVLEGSDLERRLLELEARDAERQQKHPRLAG
jgi:hypothetical protein